MLAVLLVVLFPALAVHVSCVAVMGPGTWGSGMEEKLPELLPAAANPAIAAYAREFASSDAPDQAVQGVAHSESSLQGKVFWTDRLARADLAVIGTHEGRTWVQNQHFYLSRGNGGAIRELDFPRTMILERPTLMERSGEMFIVVGRWLPWAVSPLNKLSRYLQSYRDPTLRPEFSLYLYPLRSGPLEYWGPGHSLKPSPDRRLAILLRSGALGAGYYSIHLWDFGRDRLTTIMSLREADPGSGRSFDYDWSADSRAVHITGTTGGFQRRGGQPRSLELIYLVGDEVLYDLAPPG